MLQAVLNTLAASDMRQKFNYIKAFEEQGCDRVLAETLADYLPSACGRVFLVELGAIPPDTYTRMYPDGTSSEPIKFADDPIWREVDAFVEKLRTASAESRKLLSLAGLYSSEVSTVNNAVRAGMPIENFKGAAVATVFIARRNASEQITQKPAAQAAPKSKGVFQSIVDRLLGRK
jgi:hypothetical protein